MARRLMITVDVEALPKRAAADHIERLIYGRFAGEEYGIGRMMELADRYGVKLVCFLDYAETELYGDCLLDVGRDIVNSGQDLQLHLHSYLLPRRLFVDGRVTSKRDMFVLNDSCSARCIDFMLDAHAKVTATPPIAFRGGAYRFGPAILRALARSGVLINSSYLPSRRDQPFRGLGLRKQFYWETGTLELPVSCIAQFNDSKSVVGCLKGLGRLFAYNFNASYLAPADPQKAVLRHHRYLNQFYETFGDDAIAVLVMHSWSFLKEDAAGCFSVVDPGAVERFRLLLESLDGVVEVVTATDIAGNMPEKGVDVEEIAFEAAAHAQSSLLCGLIPLKSGGASFL